MISFYKIIILSYAAKAVILFEKNRIISNNNAILFQAEEKASDFVCPSVCLLVSISLLTLDASSHLYARL